MAKKINHKVSKNNSFKNDNKILNQDEGYYKKYINKKLKKAYSKTINITEIPNLICKNLKNTLNDNKDINFDKLSYKNNIINTINVNESTIYNKKNLQKFFNKRLGQKIVDSPINEIKGKTNSCYIFDNLNSASEKIDNTSNNNTKKVHKKKKMSAVLNYFSYVKPFYRKSIKKIEFPKKEGNNNKNDVMNNKDKNNTKRSLKEINQKIQKNQIKELIDKKIELKNKIDNIQDNEIDYNEKINKCMNDNLLKTKEILEKHKINCKLAKKYFLFKEEYFSLLKIKNRLINKKNHSDIQHVIHVDINSKLNSKLYLKLKAIKNKELYILEKIFHGNKLFQSMKKMQEKLEQQKKCHILLKVVRGLIQNYDNISQIYKDDDNKKILLKALLLRYGIREKEESQNINLFDKFKELQAKININKNKMKKKEIGKDIFKNVIKEEDSEECGSSYSGLKSKPNYFKMVSWGSNDSIIKDKKSLDNTEINNKNSTPEKSYKKEKIILTEENLIDKDNIKKKIEFNDI
jgi:hypothetical protein